MPGCGCWQCCCSSCVLWGLSEKSMLGCDSAVAYELAGNGFQSASRNFGCRAALRAPCTSLTLLVQPMPQSERKLIYNNSSGRHEATCGRSFNCRGHVFAPRLAWSSKHELQAQCRVSPIFTEASCLANAQYMWSITYSIRPLDTASLIKLLVGEVRARRTR